MSFQHQINSEETTFAATMAAIPKWFTIYPLCLDALFEVVYFIGSTKDATSPEGHFYHLGYKNLVQFSYTIRAACILVERGFYFEAVILVRNLYESFFQLRYFHQHQDSLMEHWTNKHRVRIKTMFEEIAPGFYDEVYREELSEFAHSGVASSIFRTKHTSPEIGETTLGSKYDESGCSNSLNKIIVITFGMLNYIPILFPQYSGLVEESTETKRKQALLWLNEVMKAHLASKPEAQGFYDLVRPLIHI